MVRDRFMNNAERALRNQHFADFHRMMHERRRHERETRLIAALNTNRRRGIFARMRDALLNK
jgi:hypothetical protein